VILRRAADAFNAPSRFTGSLQAIDKQQPKLIEFRISA
jgi:hypothetical protein